MMNWSALWVKVFGTSSWLGLDMGFWMALLICLLVIFVMNVVVWSIHPKKREE